VGHFLTPSPYFRFDGSQLTLNFKQNEEQSKLAIINMHFVFKWEQKQD
jgi:hypothetical protein